MGKQEDKFLILLDIDAVLASESEIILRDSDNGDLTEIAEP
jgi:hypothetical protein